MLFLSPVNCKRNKYVQKMHILPTIEQVDGGVRVTVWRRNVVSTSNPDENSGENVKNIGENYLTERQLLIYAVLKANGENTAKSLARILNMDQRTECEGEPFETPGKRVGYKL